MKLKALTQQSEKSEWISDSQAIRIPTERSIAGHVGIWVADSDGQRVYRYFDGRVTLRAEVDGAEQQLTNLRRSYRPRH